MIYLILALLLAGCTIAGPKGTYLGRVDCVGKGTVQMQSTLGGAPGAMVSADCPEDPNNPGFHFTHTRERHADKVE